MVPSEHFKLVRIVVLCVATISIVCALGGMFLSYKGFAESTMLIQASATAAGGLLGLVSMRGGSNGPTNVEGNVNVTAPVATPTPVPSPFPAPHVQPIITPAP